MQQFTSQQNVLLQEIRQCISLKKKYAPTYLSVDEFASWESRHNGYFLHKGYLSIWNDIDLPEDKLEIVVQKRITRETQKPYLIFENAECFREYCRNAHLLGIEAYTLFGEKFSGKIKALAEEYSAPPSAYDELQNEVEKFTGLNFSLEDENISDEQLYASLYNYLGKTISQKVVTIFVKYGIIVNIDVSDWEETLNTNEDSIDGLVTYIDSEYERLDLNKLLGKISDMLYRLLDDKTSKCDIKDNYLRQIVFSDKATGEFISHYFASLKSRKSVWRPIAFSYQVRYSHENGAKYLKNPDFVQACGNVTIGEMISNQTKFYSNSDKKVINCMKSLADKAQDDGVYQKNLSECAENNEQIGKALSKELRTEEAVSALTRALLITALEKEQMTSFYKSEGDEYHE